MVTTSRSDSPGHQAVLRRIRWLLACWGMALLSAVGASQGMSLPGVSRQGGDTSNTAAESSASGAPPYQVELADPDLASTALKREQLTYLVRCALPAGVEVYTQQGADRFTFHGHIGLAPRWVSEAMTPSEERWVSACVLAHVNYFGKPVTVSLRALPPPVPALQASEEEHQAFSIFEGGFFGNLFAPDPVAYACQGTRTPEQAHDPVLQDRVCTQAAGTHTAAGTPTSPCHFILTGRCKVGRSLTIDGQPYAEVIFTYLRPGKHP